MKTRSMISTKQLCRALALRLRIESLQNRLHTVLGTEAEVRPESPAVKRGRKAKGGMSVAGRASVAAAMRARWRKAKKAGRR